MYEEHQDFRKPDLNAMIWRYMALNRFEWMLKESSLWFSRADKFEDKHEGSWRGYVPAERRNDPEPDVFSKNIEQWKPFQLNTTAVNCWHLNGHESDAMWKLFCPDSTGVAIQSKFCGLVESLRECSARCFVGLVNYIDPDSESFVGEGNNGFQPFLHKRKCYASENEVRAIVWRPELPSIDKGLAIKVPLETLIERLYVAPNASVQVKESVRELIDKSGCKVEVIHSSLASPPKY